MRPHKKNQQIHKYLSQPTKKSLLTPVILNLQVISNPFLQHLPQYSSIKHILQLYNDRVKNQTLTDQYQMLCHQKLVSMLVDLTHLTTKADQVNRFNIVHQWWLDKQRIILQRKQQGIIRYKITKQSRKYQYSPTHNHQIKEQTNIKSQLPNKTISQYKKQYRSIHPQLQPPQERLNQYKRKIISINQLVSPKQLIKPARINYHIQFKPKMFKQYQVDTNNQETLENSINQINIPDDQKANQNSIPEQINNVPQQINNENGGFGEEPQQPDQQQPNQIQVEDKLKPKIKPYVNAVGFPHKDNQQYSGQFMFYKGKQLIDERKMENHYISLQYRNIQKQVQEKTLIDLAHQWSKNKSNTQKQLLKKIQQAYTDPKFKLSKEQQEPKVERISLADQIKYGFTIQLKRSPKNPQIFFPQIKSSSLHYYKDQKNIRKNRINTLKHRFKNILNLNDEQKRQGVPSLCQYGSRRRGLSEILQQNSPQKQRLIQLQQAIYLKEKFKGSKGIVNLTSLCQGLCVPEQQFKSQQVLSFPQKILPSNPFWVQSSKKKKKKK